MPVVETNNLTECHFLTIRDSPDPHLLPESLALPLHVFDVEHEVGSSVFFVPDRVGAVVRSRRVQYQNRLNRFSPAVPPPLACENRPKFARLLAQKTSPARTQSTRAAFLWIRRIGSRTLGEKTCPGRPSRSPVHSLRRTGTGSVRQHALRGRPLSRGTLADQRRRPHGHDRRAARPVAKRAPRGGTVSQPAIDSLAESAAT